MGCQAWVKFSHTCFADVGERQTVVLVRHPDHTVGQARSTSIKPISGIIPLQRSVPLFHGQWCATGACITVGEPNISRDTLLTLTVNVG